MINGGDAIHIRHSRLDRPLSVALLPVAFVDWPTLDDPNQTFDAAFQCITKLTLDDRALRRDRNGLSRRLGAAGMIRGPPLRTVVPASNECEVPNRSAALITHGLARCRVLRLGVERMRQRKATKRPIESESALSRSGAAPSQRVQRRVSSAGMRSAITGRLK